MAWKYQLSLLLSGATYAPSNNLRSFQQPTLVHRNNLRPLTEAKCAPLQQQSTLFPVTLASSGPFTENQNHSSCLNSLLRKLSSKKRLSVRRGRETQVNSPEKSLVPPILAQICIRDQVNKRQTRYILIDFPKRLLVFSPSIRRNGSLKC